MLKINLENSRAKKVGTAKHLFFHCTPCPSCLGLQEGEFQIQDLESRNFIC